MVLMASNQLRCVVCGDKVTLGTQRCNNKFFKCKMNGAIYKIDSDGCPIFHAVFTNIASTENG